MIQMLLEPSLLGRGGRQKGIEYLEKFLTGTVNLVGFASYMSLYFRNTHSIKRAMKVNFAKDESSLTKIVT